MTDHANSTTVQRYNGSTTVQRYNGTTVQRYKRTNGTTVQTYKRTNGTTVQRYKRTNGSFRRASAFQLLHLRTLLLAICSQRLLIQIFLNATMTFIFEISRAICKDGSAGGRLGSFTPASKTVNSLERACKGEGGEGDFIGRCEINPYEPTHRKGKRGERSFISGAAFICHRTETQHTESKIRWWGLCVNPE